MLSATLIAPRLIAPRLIAPRLIAAAAIPLWPRLLLGPPPLECSRRRQRIHMSLLSRHCQDWSRLFFRVAELEVGCDAPCMCSAWYSAYPLWTLATVSKGASRGRRALGRCQGPPPPAQAPRDPWSGGEMSGSRSPGGEGATNAEVYNCRLLHARRRQHRLLRHKHAGIPAWDQTASRPHLHQSLSPTHHTHSL